jgi:protoporphyrinogen oxidase
MTADVTTSVAIIGAGPTGIGAAYRLLEHGCNDWLIVEGAKSAGGLASSVIDENGFVWDMGGHVIFSHYEYFDKLVDRAMGDEWCEHIREAWVWMRDRFIPYPFQKNIWRLPQEELNACIEGLKEIQNLPPDLKQARTFEDWILSSFGRGLADTFFLPYNFKVWAYEPRKLSACWMQERVATVDLAQILRNKDLQQDELGWGPNAKFRFPERGGTGEIWRRLGSKLPKDKIRLGSTVSYINTKERVLTLEGGMTIGYDSLISTMPLDVLLQIFEDRPDLASYANKFIHSATNIVGIGMEGQPPEHLATKCWMYFPEPDLPFYRVTVFSNYSPNNVPAPGKYWSLLCEVSESLDKPVDHKTLTDDVIAALKKAKMVPAQQTSFASVFSERLPYGYPTPFLGRDELLEKIDPQLRQSGIYSRGRFGAWKYEVSNQDHSVMMGVEAVDHILCETPESTYEQPLATNAKRNQIGPLPKRTHPKGA